MRDILYYDCHRHYYGGKLETLVNVVKSSPYALKYMCYQSINYSAIENETAWMDDKVAYFLIPFVLKETEIGEANKRLLDYSKNKGNMLQVPLVGDDLREYEKYERLIGLKEHFLIHSYSDKKNRKTFYEYLNQRRKMLLLHCKDNVRLEYIEWLRENFPNMYIQIAHLGVDRRANDLTRILLDKYKADDHIFYDISTVINEKLLDYAMENISSQLLFGSDYPYSPDNNVNYLLNYCKTSNLLCKMNANAELIIELTRK